MPDNWVEIKNLFFSLDDRCIFDGIDMVVKQGKITAIMGPCLLYTSLMWIL